MKVQSMRIFSTFLAAGALLTALASVPASADPVSAPPAPTPAMVPATASVSVSGKPLASAKATPRIGMLMTTPMVTTPRLLGRRSHVSNTASWLPNASDAIRRQ